MIAVVSLGHSGHEKCSRNNNGLLENEVPDCISGIFLPEENYVSSILSILFLRS